MPILRRIAEMPFDYLVVRRGTDYYLRDPYGRQKYRADEIGAAINEAIDALTKGGLIALGQFTIQDPATLETTISFPETNLPIHLIGMGYDKSAIKLANGKNINMIDITPTADSYFHEISRLTLNGNKANNTSGIGIYINNADGGNVYDFHLKHAYVHDFAEEGMQTDNFWGYRILSDLFERCGKDGLYISGGKSGHIGFCRFGANGQYGLQLGANQGTVVSCELETAQKIGCYIVGAYNAILGGFVENNSQVGAGAWSGVQLAATADYTRIVNVLFLGQNREIYGVKIVAGVTDCRIDQCYFTGHTTAPISDAGTRTRINGQGAEAAGIGGTPTAANWDVGDIVHNTDDNTFWIKDTAGTMRKLA